MTILTTTQANVGEHQRTSANGRLVESAYLNGFLNAGERLRTYEFGLWLKRRSRVRAPSVTLSLAQPQGCRRDRPPPEPPHATEEGEDKWTAGVYGRAHHKPGTVRCPEDDGDEKAAPR